MRTTIELPNDLRQKLITESASRHMKGFSEIIVDALKKYFKNVKSKRKDIINNLEGCLSKKENEREKQRLKEGRENWRE